MGREGKKLGRIAPPKGTRDLYPEEALKRRYLEQCWRDASIRCGFEEIHGPTFESADLYAVKSGEGILGELFQAFSGKSGAEVEQVMETGRAPFAMRPEFTPTLARMYAARANGLPSPCKWFTGGSYFRAERPQRGRLREFLQWNVDVIGLPGDGGAEAKAQMDAETVGVGVSLCRDVGLGLDDVAVHHSDRDYIAAALTESGIPGSGLEEALALLDKSAKLERGAFETQARALGMNLDRYERAVGRGSTAERLIAALTSEEGDWCRWDASVVRGLAYYTGTVFEVLADGERAVAGGGRYDKLIELMGGPPTPAVGFAMGDVVVSLLLEEKGLMPQGAELMDAVSRRPASVRPEVFVVGADDETSDPLVRRLCADLRRGVESERYREDEDRKPWSGDRYSDKSGGVRPMHARVSYKSTRSLKKLLGDAEKQQARLVAVVHGEHRVQLKDLDTRQDLTPKDVGLSDSAAEFSVDPQSPVSIGRAATRVLG